MQYLGIGTNNLSAAEDVCVCAVGVCGVWGDVMERVGHAGGRRYIVWREKR